MFPLQMTKNTPRKQFDNGQLWSFWLADLQEFDQYLSEMLKPLFSRDQCYKVLSRVTLYNIKGTRCREAERFPNLTEHIHFSFLSFLFPQKPQMSFLLRSYPVLLLDHPLHPSRFVHPHACSLSIPISLDYLSRCFTLMSKCPTRHSPWQMMSQTHYALLIC